MPIAAELANLLGIHFEQQRRGVLVPSGNGLHVRHIQCAPGSGVQDAHQRALRIAIANVKSVHFVLPNLLQTTFPITPLPLEPWDRRWLPAGNRKPATPVLTNAESVPARLRFAR